MKNDRSNYQKILISFIGISLFLVSAISIFPFESTKPTEGYMIGEGGQLYVPNRVVIKFNENSQNFEAVAETARGNRIITKENNILQFLTRRTGIPFNNLRFYSPTGNYIVETSGNPDIEALCRKLRTESAISDASPDYLASISSTSQIPNDPLFIYQYSLVNTGQIYIPDLELKGKSGCDINALEGWGAFEDWKIETGNAGTEVIIAILDTGVAGDHVDIKNNMLSGYNFVDENSNAYDDNGHGTFVASIAAAETNNGFGIAGVCPYAKIMPVKVIRADGYGSYLVIAAGIKYAADHGAKIINLSVGGKNPSFILEDACKYAYEKGCLIVVAAGNYNTTVFFPAAYDDYCLAIAATDASDQWAYYSNPGPQIDVAAPGTYLWGASFNPASPSDLNEYTIESGTSVAAPIVAGAAGLLLMQKPFLTNAQVMDLLRYTAVDVNGDTYKDADQYIGYGRINLSRLLGPYIPR